MQHNHAAQQQPGEKPASAPNASQNTRPCLGGGLGESRMWMTSASASLPSLRRAAFVFFCFFYFVKSKLRRKWRGDTPSSLPGLHETIPSGKDTGRAAWSSDLCRGWSTGHNPCQSHTDSSRNLYQARCERGTTDNCINHGRNKQAEWTPTADPCAQLISLHVTIPSEGAMQKAYQTDKKATPLRDMLHGHEQRLRRCPQPLENSRLKVAAEWQNFLAQAPWDEKRDGLITIQTELVTHLNSHNLICRHLTVMLEKLPTEAIPTAESKILQQLHRILQNSMLLSWPQECLRLETCTAGFADIISEIAQFESQRLGFMFTLKSTLLEIYNRLLSTQKLETEKPQPNLAPFLDMRLTLKWVQFILPAEFTYSLLKSTTLHDTFGPFGEIAEIFLFTLQPENFIIFHVHLTILNIDVIVSPQNNLIQIKNLNYSSLLIRSAGPPHFPTRRPALGTPDDV